MIGRSCAVAALLLLAAAARGDDHLISLDAAVARASLPPPPGRGSRAERADLDAVLRVQAAASAADRRRAGSLADAELGTLFGPPYGPLSPPEVRAWAPLFSRVADDADAVVGRLKKKYARPRPYALDERVEALPRKDHGLSYPSGGAAIAEVMARLLSDLRPDRTRAFLARAAQIGHDRIVAGAHHPTDVSAGLALGDQLAPLFRESAAFRAVAARGGTP